MSASTLASVNPTHNQPPHAQQNPGGERSDDIDPAFGIPVMLPGAALSTRCIPIGARHVMGKTTLVDIDNGPGIALTRS